MHLLGSVPPRQEVGVVESNLSNPPTSFPPFSDLYIGWPQPVWRSLTKQPQRLDSASACAIVACPKEAQMIFMAHLRLSWASTNNLHYCKRGLVCTFNEWMILLLCLVTDHWMCFTFTNLRFYLLYAPLTAFAEKWQCLQISFKQKYLQQFTNQYHARVLRTQPFTPHSWKDLNGRHSFLKIF